MSEFNVGYIEEENWDELVCEECKICKYYQHQLLYCKGDEEPCERFTKICF